MGSIPMLSTKVATNGAVAQLGERLDGIEKVMGSIPFRSTVRVSAPVAQWKSAPLVRGRPWVQSPPGAPVRAGIAKSEWHLASNQK